MKKLAKKIVAKILGWQLHRLKKKNNFKVVAVAGSVGKTSTKLAVAQILKQNFRVQYQDGNYNDLVTVPLVFFGQSEPSVFNPFAWARTFLRNEKVLWRKYPFDWVVVELGSDQPGQMSAFKPLLKADIGILTAIAPEHMESFDDLNAVAEEELVISEISAKLFVNIDLCAKEYINDLQASLITYAIKQPADIRMERINFDGLAANFDIISANKVLVHAQHEQVTEPQLYSITAAAAVAINIGMAGAPVPGCWRSPTAWAVMRRARWRPNW